MLECLLWWGVRSDKSIVGAGPGELTACINDDCAAGFQWHPSEDEWTYFM